MKKSPERRDFFVKNLLREFLKNVIHDAPFNFPHFPVDPNPPSPL